MRAPCHKCPDRAVGCHSSCSAYLIYHEERERCAEERLRDDPFKGFRRAGMTRVLREKHRKGRRK